MVKIHQRFCTRPNLFVFEVLFFEIFKILQFCNFVIHLYA